MAQTFPYAALETQYANGIRQRTLFEERLAFPFPYPAIERLRQYAIKNILNNKTTFFNLGEPALSIDHARPVAVRAYANSILNELGLLVEGIVPTPDYLLMPNTQDAFGAIVQATTPGSGVDRQVFSSFSMAQLVNALYQIPIIDATEAGEMVDAGIPQPHIDLLQRYADTGDKITNVKVALVAVVLTGRVLYTPSVGNGMISNNRLISNGRPVI